MSQSRQFTEGMKVLIIGDKASHGCSKGSVQVIDSHYGGSKWILRGTSTYAYEGDMMPLSEVACVLKEAGSTSSVVTPPKPPAPKGMKPRLGLYVDAGGYKGDIIAMTTKYCIIAREDTEGEEYSVNWGSVKGIFVPPKKRSVS